MTPEISAKINLLVHTFRYAHHKDRLHLHFPKIKEVLPWSTHSQRVHLFGALAPRDLQHREMGFQLLSQIESEKLLLKGELLAQFARKVSLFEASRSATFARISDAFLEDRESYSLKALLTLGHAYARRSHPDYQVFQKVWKHMPRMIKKGTSPELCWLAELLARVCAPKSLGPLVREALVVTNLHQVSGAQIGATVAALARIQAIDLSLWERLLSYLEGQQRLSLRSLTSFLYALHRMQGPGRSACVASLLRVCKEHSERAEFLEVPSGQTMALLASAGAEDPEIQKLVGRLMEAEPPLRLQDYRWFLGSLSWEALGARIWPLFCRQLETSVSAFLFEGLAQVGSKHPCKPKWLSLLDWYALRLDAEPPSSRREVLSTFRSLGLTKLWAPQLMTRLLVQVDSLKWEYEEGAIDEVCRYAFLGGASVSQLARLRESLLTKSPSKTRNIRKIRDLEEAHQTDLGDPFEGWRVSLPEVSSGLYRISPPKYFQDLEEIWKSSGPLLAPPLVDRLNQLKLWLVPQDISSVEPEWAGSLLKKKSTPQSPGLTGRAYFRETHWILPCELSQVCFIGTQSRRPLLPEVTLELRQFAAQKRHPVVAWLVPTVLSAQDCPNVIDFQELPEI